MPESSSDDRQRALQLLDHIRAALEEEDVATARFQVESLQKYLATWQQGNARAQLEAALKDDLLLLNTDLANRYLQEWESALTDEDSRDDLEQYQIKVQKRIQQKQTDLQVLGVTAHVNALWQKAAESETGERSAHPDTLLAEYYTKARDLVAVAHAEYGDDAGLDTLLKKATDLRQKKVAANKIFPTAITQQAYAEVLDTLARWDASQLVPRFHIKDSDPGEGLVFDRMITVTDARTEIEQLGRAWTEKRLPAMLAAQEHLHAYQPQLALDALAERQKVERFLDAGDWQTLETLHTQAVDALAALEQAEQRAQDATALITENTVQAWNTYVEAYHLYNGAPSLNPTRQAITTQMAVQLAQMRTEAENAFIQKNLERVQKIYRNARHNFSDKDTSLDAILEHIAEIDWNAQRFLEMLQDATTMLGQIQAMASEDIASADEMLSRLNEYPDTVLEELADYPAVRKMVSQYVKMESDYQQLSQLLRAGNFAAVQQGVRDAEQYIDEPRFDRLIGRLQMHGTFLTAKRHRTAGNLEVALGLFEQVANADGHPDQAEAIHLAAQTRAAIIAAQEPPPAPGISPDEDNSPSLPRE